MRTRLAAEAWTLLPTPCSELPLAELAAPHALAYCPRIGLLSELLIFYRGEGKS
jgi:hypothetical protein